MIEYVVFLGQMDLNDHKIQNVGSLLYLYLNPVKQFQKKMWGFYSRQKKSLGIQATILELIIRKYLLDSEKYNKCREQHQN